METQVVREPLSLQQGSDSALIEHSLRGDQAAFEALVLRYRPSLYTFVRRRMLNDGQAEDIVQSVLLQLYLSLPQLHQHLSFKHSAMPLRAWLFRVAANRCIDESRRKRPLHFSEIATLAFDAGEVQEDAFAEEKIIDPAPLPEEATERLDLHYALITAIDALPSKFRAIVSLRYAEELTFKEIGLRLHMPENTAKTYFRRALPLLRASLVECA